MTNVNINGNITLKCEGILIIQTWIANIFCYFVCRETLLPLFLHMLHICNVPFTNLICRDIGPYVYVL